MYSEDATLMRDYILRSIYTSQHFTNELEKYICGSMVSLFLEENHFLAFVTHYMLTSEYSEG